MIKIDNDGKPERYNDCYTEIITNFYIDDNHHWLCCKNGDDIKRLARFEDEAAVDEFKACLKTFYDRCVRHYLQNRKTVMEEWMSLFQ